MSLNTIFDDFYKFTKKDISLYFARVLDFMQTDYQTIVQYYQGKTQKINSLPFTNFTNVQKETQEVFQLFQKFNKQMNNVKWWDLITQIEEIDNRLNTLANINRWARSSQKTVGYSPNPQVNIIINQNGSLERISQDLLGSTDSQDDWVSLAIDNQLEEQDYSSTGGTSVLVTLQNKPGSNFQITSVVDIITGTSVYGVDLDKELHFDSDNDYDLAILSNLDTILQAVNILMTLRKNDNPDFPDDGLQGSILIGGTQATFNFPIIMRQLNQTFQTDDTLKNLTITGISHDQDNILVNFTIYSRLGELLPVTQVSL